MKSLLFAVITLISHVVPEATAMSSDDSLRSFIRARSAIQLAKADKITKRARKLELVCDVELRGKRIPFACFELLDEDGADRKSHSWLTDLCLTRARESVDRIELAKTWGNKHLPESCRAAASIRAGDLKYTDQVERPAELFRRRSEAL